MLSKDLEENKEYIYIGKLQDLKNKTVLYIEPAYELFRVKDIETEQIYTVMAESLAIKILITL